MSEGFKVSSVRSMFKVRFYYVLAYLTFQRDSDYLAADSDRLGYEAMIFLSSGSLSDLSEKLYSAKSIGASIEQSASQPEHYKQCASY